MVRDEQEYAASGAELDGEVLARTLARLERMPREGHAARLEIARHRRLALVVRASLGQARERHRRALAADHLGQRRRRDPRRAVARVEHLAQPGVDLAAQEEHGLPHGIAHSRNSPRAFSDMRAARSARGSPRSSATRAAVIARYAGSLRLPR